jgi:hypothetical protein
MNPLNGEEELRESGDVSKEKVQALEDEVRTWSPASSVFWALWGVIQAEEQVVAVMEENDKFEAEFDYLVGPPCDYTDRSPTPSSACRCSDKKQQSSVYSGRCIGGRAHDRSCT